MLWRTVFCSLDHADKQSKLSVPGFWFRKCQWQCWQCRAHWQRARQKNHSGQARTQRTTKGRRSLRRYPHLYSFPCSAGRRGMHCPPPCFSHMALECGERARREKANSGARGSAQSSLPFLQGHSKDKECPRRGVYHGSEQALHHLIPAPQDHTHKQRDPGKKRVDQKLLWGPGAWDRVMSGFETRAEF